MKRKKFFEYLPPIPNYSWLTENPEWEVTAFVIYNPTRRKEQSEVDPASGCYQMFWPINPWSALDA